MYEIHDNAEAFFNEVPFGFEEDLPEPPEYWSLRDFGDVVPMWGMRHDIP